MVDLLQDMAGKYRSQKDPISAYLLVLVIKIIFCQKKTKILQDWIYVIILFHMLQMQTILYSLGMIDYM